VLLHFDLLSKLSSAIEEAPSFDREGRTRTPRGCKDGDSCNVASASTSSSPSFFPTCAVDEPAELSAKRGEVGS
jgi:hypothetical protein